MAALTLFLVFNSAANLKSCLALQPQSQSLSEWDESGAPSSSFAAKDDSEFVQLDAQAGTATTAEAKSQTQAEI